MEFLAIYSPYPSSGVFLQYLSILLPIVSIQLQKHLNNFSASNLNIIAVYRLFFPFALPRLPNKVSCTSTFTEERQRPPKGFSHSFFCRPPPSILVPALFYKFCPRAPRSSNLSKLQRRVRQLSLPRGTHGIRIFCLPQGANTKPQLLSI